MVRALNKFSVLIITILLVLTCLVILPVSPASNISTRADLESGIIVSFSDEAIDNNNDTSYDVLYLTIRLNIQTTDIYDIYATLSPSGFDAKDFKKDHFAAGEHDVVLSFDGSDIYTSGRDGPYLFKVSVYNGYGNLIAELENSTQPYNFEDFNPSPAAETTGMESITVVNNTIKLETNLFVAVIYEQTPMILFYYTSDDGMTARFRVTYNNIIGYNDLNNDGKFQKDELVYWGDLPKSHWNSPKTLMEDFNNFDFQVQTIVDLVDMNNNPISTKLGLVFHYSSLSKADNPEAARKFDVSIKILGAPLKGITHIALEHTLNDDFGNHDFLESPIENKISFVTHDGKEHGYYSWKNYIEITTGGSGSTNKIVTYNLEQTSEVGTNKLYLNYPYSLDTTELYHDPVVGVNPDNIPMIPLPREPDIITHNRWSIVYITVALVVAGIMIGNFYHQKKKKKY